MSGQPSDRTQYPGALKAVALTSWARTGPWEPPGAPGIACRYSGSRLLVLAPNTGQRAAERIKDEIGAAVNGSPRIRCACVVWRPGESGDDVLARARLELQTTRV